jgi:hypothetical protein
VKYVYLSRVGKKEYLLSQREEIRKRGKEKGIGVEEEWLNSRISPKQCELRTQFLI